MKMTIGAAMAMALMLSLPLTTSAQEAAPSADAAADVSAGAVDTAAQEADNTSNAAVDAADNASEAAGDAIENSADEANDAADNAADRVEDAQQASDDAQNRAADELNADGNDAANRNNESTRSTELNAQGAINVQSSQPYATGYRGTGQVQHYNQHGQPVYQGQQQAYYNDGYQRHNGQQQAYYNHGNQGHAGQQTAHHQNADHGWGENHPSVGQQEWMCIDGRRQLVTIVSVSQVAREEGSQNYPERAVQYEDGQQPLPAAPENFEGDRNREQFQNNNGQNNNSRNDSQTDRSTPPPVPQSNDDAVRQAPVGSQPAATNQSATPSGPADGSFEGAADRNGGRQEATDIRD